MTQPDPIDAAIAAAQKPVALNQITVTISSTGRQVVLGFPPDMTDSELLEFIGWASTNLRLSLAGERQKRAGGRILIPTGVMVDR